MFESCHLTSRSGALPFVASPSRRQVRAVTHCYVQFGRRGFTLIELILVMAIITIVIALVTPKLADFFGGRSLASEARRFVSTTRYGQSRAVSEGVPIMLWIDVKNGMYGLKQETGYNDGDRKSMDFTVDKALKINVSKGTLATSRSLSAQPKRGALPGIHFSPDGTIIGATSVPAVSFDQGSKNTLWIVPAANRLTYEVQSQNGNFSNNRR